MILTYTRMLPGVRGTENFGNNLLWIIQVNKIVPSRKKIIWGIEIQTNHQNQERTPDLVLFNKKKQTCQRVDIDV